MNIALRWATKLAIRLAREMHGLKTSTIQGKFIKSLANLLNCKLVFIFYFQVENVSTSS